MLCPNKFAVLWRHRAHVRVALGPRLAQGLIMYNWNEPKYMFYSKGNCGIWSKHGLDTLPRDSILLSPDDLMRITFPPFPKKLLTDKGAPKNETNSNPKSSDHETSQVPQQETPEQPGVTAEGTAGT